MVRIKVIHASKLLAAAAAVILAIALIVLAAGAAFWFRVKVARMVVRR